MNFFKELDLRQYQLDAVEALRGGIRQGHRSQILVAPTGAGKTAIAAYLMREGTRKQARSAFIVDRVNLVDQVSMVLDEYRIDHGVVQAGHWRRRDYETIQICSAQTIERRGYFPKDIKLIVVDECHSTRRSVAALIEQTQAAKVIGLTATPFTNGLSKIYSNLVNVSTTNALIDDGFLVPLKMYAAKAIDMTGAKVVAGEWSDKEIEKRGVAIIGNIVAEWQNKTHEQFGKAVKTIVFSATVDHGRELCSQFQAAGYNFQQLSYLDGSDEKRRDLIEEFRKHESTIDGLVACEVLTKGFDVPDVMCGISARPYRKSLSSHIQQLGRVMRPAPGKAFGLWLDHSGNALRFQNDVADIFEHGAVSLEEAEKRDGNAHAEPPDDLMKNRLRCSRCMFVLPTGADCCPSCGFEIPKRSLLPVVPGVMIQIGGAKVLATGKYAWLANPKHIWDQLVIIALARKGPDIDAARRYAQAQYRNIYGDFARRIIEDRDIEAYRLGEDAVDPKLKSLLMSFQIRWARRRRSA